MAHLEPKVSFVVFCLGTFDSVLVLLDDFWWFAAAILEQLRFTSTLCILLSLIVVYQYLFQIAIQIVVGCLRFLLTDEALTRCLLCQYLSFDHSCIFAFHSGLIDFISLLHLSAGGATCMLSHLTESFLFDFDVFVHNQLHHVVVQIGERRICFGTWLLSLQRWETYELVQHFFSGALLFSVHVQQILDSLLVGSLFVFQDVEMVVGDNAQILIVIHVLLLDSQLRGRWRCFIRFLDGLRQRAVHLLAHLVTSQGGFKTSLDDGLSLSGTRWSWFAMRYVLFSNQLWDRWHLWALKEDRWLDRRLVSCHWAFDFADRSQFSIWIINIIYVGFIDRCEVVIFAIWLVTHVQL